MIYFQDKNHEYFSENNEKYTPVSTLYGQFKPKYDEDYWSKYKALEKLIPGFKKMKGNFSSEREAVRILSKEMDSTKFHETVQQIKDSWKKSNKSGINKGNLYHKDAEKMAYIRGLMENPFTGTSARVIKLEKTKGYSNHSLKTNLYDLEDGFYPELLMWNDEYKIAGQSDKVFITTSRGTRYVDIDDYKTNKEIRKAGFRGERMLPPINHLQNCNYIHYSLAISLYAWMMEEFGFTVRHLGFHHYNNKYDIEYLKDDVLKMLRYHKNRNLQEMP